MYLFLQFNLEYILKVFNFAVISLPTRNLCSPNPETVPLSLTYRIHPGEVLHHHFIFVQGNIGIF